MKKTLLAGAVVLVALCASCDKERQCKCAPKNDDGLLRILTVDRSMKCKNITSTMVEEKRVVDGEQTLVRYDTIVFNCRDYAEQ